MRSQCMLPGIKTWEDEGGADGAAIRGAHLRTCVALRARRPPARLAEESPRREATAARISAGRCSWPAIHGRASDSERPIPVFGCPLFDSRMARAEEATPMTTWMFENVRDSRVDRRAGRTEVSANNCSRATSAPTSSSRCCWCSSGRSAVSFALLVTPYTWAGETRSLHLHVWAAIILGGGIVSLPVALTMLRPAAAITRHAVAIGQMLMSLLMIHLAGGRIEVHFHVFVSLAFLHSIATGRSWSRPRLWSPSTISCGEFLAEIGLRRS